MKDEHESRAVIRHQSELSEPQRLRLLVDVLAFFTAEQGRPDVKLVREMLQDSRFEGYRRPVLNEMVKALVASGLLFKPPQLTARSSGYITTKIGREMRAEYLTRLEDR